MNSKTIIILMVGAMCLNVGCKKQVTGRIEAAQVNGVSLLYQMKGPSDGKPAVVIHGNGGSHNDLITITDALAQSGYLVWAPDSRGQGANAPLTEYHYTDMAEDIYCFVQEIIVPYYGSKAVHPVVFGWSDGGIIALLSEIMHPGTWSAIATSGANIHPDCGAWDLEAERAHPADTSALYRMMLYEPDITLQELGTIQCPCLIAAGEYDLIREDHTRLIADHIPDSKMLIIPGADHGSHIIGSTQMADTLLCFLQAHRCR